ncbi:MAG: carbohydrate kinase family protein [Verrucomicrobiota bacterium]|nr:carbohydrate kinase family protein [Verrucomicrobiota bacterium]
MSTDDSRSGILAGGNWLLDFVKIIDIWPAQDQLATILRQTVANGGGPYNVLKDLRKLGAPFPLSGIGLLGDDANGHTIRADCEKHGIDTAQLHTSPTSYTSYTDVMSAQDTGRRTFFHHRGTNALLGTEHFDFSSTKARIFYLGYLLLLDRMDIININGETGATTVLRAARKAGLRTFVDVVSVAHPKASAIIEAALGEVDILCLNEFEAGLATGLELGQDKEIDTATIRNAARVLLDCGVNEAVVIHFSRGVHVVTKDGRAFHQAALKLPKEKITGATGAGDALAAGLLYALHEGWSWPRALELAVCVAASSLFDPSASDGILPLAQCLQLKDIYA